MTELTDTDIKAVIAELDGSEDLSAADEKLVYERVLERLQGLLNEPLQAGPMPGPGTETVGNH